MPRKAKRDGVPAQPVPDLTRIARPLSLAAQVEQILRQAVAEKRWARGRLPTEIELAEQLGVSRETVRLAAEVLQREGLLVKIRRKGTFTTTPQKILQLQTVQARLLRLLANRSSHHVRPGRCGQSRH